MTRSCVNSIEFQFKPKFTSTADSNENYFIDFIFDSGYSNSLGSNLTIGENYPNYMENFSDSAFIILSANKTLSIRD